MTIFYSLLLISFCNHFISSNNNSGALIRNVSTNSDIILIFCPSSNFKGKNGNVKFKVNYNIHKYSNYLNYSMNSQVNLFYLYIPEKKLSNLNINCGQVKSNNNTITPLNIKINWLEEINPLKNSKIYDAYFGTENIKKACENQDVLILIKRNHRIQLHYLNEEFKINDIAYVFDKMKMSDFYGIPCQIFKIKHPLPKIHLTTYNVNERMIQKKVKKFGVPIIKVLKNEYNKKYTVHLKTSRKSKSPNFFINENVVVREMKFLRHNRLDIKSLKIMKNNTFMVSYFEIVEVEYICHSCTNEYIAKQLYFFGPQGRNYEKIEKDVIYYGNKLEKEPYCSLEKYTFAYLESIKFNDSKVTIDKLMYKSNKSVGIFKLNQSNVIITDEAPHGTLTCEYHMPDGLYITQKKYLNNDILESYEKNYKWDIIGLFIAKVAVGTIISTLIGLLIIGYYFRVDVRHTLESIKLSQIYPNIEKFAWECSTKRLQCINDIINNSWDDGSLTSIEGTVIDKIPIMKEEDLDDYNSIIKREKNIYNLSVVRAHKLPFYKNNKKNYIIANCPTKLNIYDFYKLILEEKVEIVLVITDYPVNAPENSYYEYWNDLDLPLKDITLTLMSNLPSTVKDTNVVDIEITSNKDEKQEFILITVNWWPLNVQPFEKEKILSLYFLFESYLGSGSIIIHTGDIPDSRVLTFLSLCCSVERFRKNKKFTNVISVIENIRKTRHGMQIVPRTISQIISNIMYYFVLKGYIRSGYEYISWKKFQYQFIVNHCNVVPYQEPWISNLYNYFQNLTYKTLENITVYYKYEDVVLGSLPQIYWNYNKKKDRPSEQVFGNIIIPYKTTKVLTIYDRNKYDPVSPYSIFVEYLMPYENETSQTTLYVSHETDKRMEKKFFEKIYEDNIESIVLTLKVSDNSYYRFFPDRNEGNKTRGNFKVLYIKETTYYKNSLIIIHYVVIKLLDNTSKSFKLYHYLNCPEDGLTLDLHVYLKIFESVIENGRNILILDKKHTGRPGVLVLSLALKYSLLNSEVMDPLQTASILCSKYNDLIERSEQIILALRIIVTHYRLELDHMTEGGYEIIHKMLYREQLYRMNLFNEVNKTNPFKKRIQIRLPKRKQGYKLFKKPVNMENIGKYNEPKQREQTMKHISFERDLTDEQIYDTPIIDIERDKSAIPTEELGMKKEMQEEIIRRLMNESRKK
uniref:Tyrosine-protein phosphatase domain-containing protein n=1 Tax=Parastrongyloides trichosuri TaxID=131310 RepID=A0A0N4ZY71_PARTI